jgi:hypothetical protein
MVTQPCKAIGQSMGQRKHDGSIDKKLEGVGGKLGDQYTANRMRSDDDQGGTTSINLIDSVGDL